MVERTQNTVTCMFVRGTFNFGHSESKHLTLFTDASARFISFQPGTTADKL